MEERDQVRLHAREMQMRGFGDGGSTAWNTAHAGWRIDAGGEGSYCWRWRCKGGCGRRGQTAEHTPTHHADDERKGARANVSANINAVEDLKAWGEERRGGVKVWGRMAESVRRKALAAMPTSSILHCRELKPGHNNPKQSPF